MYDRPLGDRILRPLLAGLLWAYVTASAAGIIVGLVAGGTSLVRLVGSWIGSGGVRAPWNLALDTAGFLAPFVVASSTWAATYGSSERNTVIRALAGTALGVAVLVAAVRSGAPQLTPAAFAVAWSVAIPFEHWTRPAARLVAALAVTAALWPLWPAGPAAWWTTLASPLAAAIPLALADRLWRLARRRPPQ